MLPMASTASLGWPRSSMGASRLAWYMEPNVFLKSIM